MLALRLLALCLTTISLVPSAAHLFELPGKIGLERSAYFTVQGIYAGWSHFAIPIVAAIVANAALAAVEWRRDTRASRFALASAVLIVLSLADFFTLVLPGNVATRNWTQPTSDWAALRIHWEYGHATGAVLMTLAFLATALSTLRRGR